MAYKNIDCCCHAGLSQAAMIGLSSLSLYPAMMNGSAPVLPHQETGFPVVLSINAL